MSARFLTIADVAEQLQLSAQGVRALIRSGDLPAIQVGARRLWRIEDQALEDYIQRQLASTRAMVAAGTFSEDEDADHRA
ncbi:helix-turn-helix domain-containing protein [Actinomyces wuliandei]|uniref:helix-turn-helix domain-containing protein n=1 Tax=Actinomyces wuliandei TaxID=2057743 RepID=UPI000FDA29A1|nr:helix-turn-helix domain-containing protein [Actinomyces wuliandei]